MIPARQNSDHAREFLASCRPLIDSQLDLLIPKESDEPQRVHAAIRWSVFAGGKRFRPALLLVTGQTFGANVEDMLRAAPERLRAWSPDSRSTSTPNHETLSRNSWTESIIERRVR